MNTSRTTPLCGLVVGLVLATTGCVGGNQEATPPETETETTPDTDTDTDTDVPTDTGLPIDDVLFFAKSGTTTLAPDGSWFASTNRDEGSITLFAFTGDASLDGASTTTFNLGGPSPELSSVVAGHDGSYLLATLQYDQQLCRIDVTQGVGQTPLCVATGSEPTAVVTNEDGSRIYVANMVDGSIAVYDEGLESVGTIDFSDANGETGVHPFALLYLKQEDASGNLYITDFFAEKVPGGREGSDTGRQGVVYKVAGDAVNADEATKIVLPPLEETGFRIPSDDPLCAGGPDSAGCANDTSGAFPNQLASIFYDSGRIFVASTCASPRGEVKFNMNLHSCVHVIDAETDTEIPDLRLNIQERIKQQAAGEDKLFCTVPTDFACVPESPFCYATCGSSDLVIRLDYNDFNAASEVEAGIETVKNLPTGKFPTGISILVGDAPRAFVNNENSYDVTSIDLQSQTPLGETSTGTLPAEGTLEDRLLKGKDFFFTGRGRWSDGRWSSCVGCHPRGLTDNVTWHFPTGPRQTVSMDGSFSKENVTPDAIGNRHGFASVVAALEADAEFPQRIFNWTSVRDEVSDFELNTRGVSGGLGAIVDAQNNRIDLAGGNEAQDALVAGGIGNNTNNLGSNDELIDRLDTNRDWDEITEWARTIRAPRAKTNVAGDALRGQLLFEATYNCDSCHAGGSWTNAIRYYDPEFASNSGSFTTRTLQRFFALDLVDESTNNLILAQTPLLDDFAVCSADEDCCLAFDEEGQCVDFLPGSCDTEAGRCASPLLAFEFYVSSPRGINEHACVLRNVGTFESPDNAEGALEVRKNMATIAQGQAGFNIPSLFNLQAGAPYLHNGRFESLTEFLLDTDDTEHIVAGSAVATINDEDARDLVAFLLSIDGSTAAPPQQRSDLVCEPLDFSDAR